MRNRISHAGMNVTAGKRPAAGEGRESTAPVRMKGGIDRFTDSHDRAMAQARKTAFRSHHRRRSAGDGRAHEIQEAQGQLTLAPRPGASK